MVLIFICAIVPGWVTEQDPWQRVWATRNERSARNGMAFGAVLVALVFAGCAAIAIGLNALYPDIAAMGFPMGMRRAEPALLTFIMERAGSALPVALCAVALATAAMSCTDTFAASGASCLARDVYQRYLRPSATMREMRLVNRAAVLVIVASATAASFLIHSIIDAIHIATFIASASYFFVLVGGLYWRRATGAGAAASLCAGFTVQVALVWLDISRSTPLGAPYLESMHPILMGHGVIVAMLISGGVFAGVSLATRPSPQVRLVPFFKAEADAFAAVLKDREDGCRNDRIDGGEVVVRRSGGMVRLHADDVLVPELWEALIAALSSEDDRWVRECGADAVCRYGGGEFLTRVTVTRGDGPATLWFAAEGPESHCEGLAQAMLKARNEARLALRRISGGTDFIGQSVGTVKQTASDYSSVR